MVLHGRWTFQDRFRRLCIPSCLVAIGLLVVGCLGQNAPSPTPSPKPTVGVISSTVRTQDGMVMVYVPAGTFTMGRDLAPDDQRPGHDVTLDAFWLDQTEVTNAEYDPCAAAGVCSASDFADDRQLNGDTQPVAGVSWFDADAYCAWVGARLATEAEWEYAARGPEEYAYPWGNEALPGYANCANEWCGDQFPATAPVGSFPQGASWVGALDLSGNVWEWINDWYAAGYYGVSPEQNPSGPAEGTTKVIRGGSWQYNLANIRATMRGAAYPAARSQYLGFRCAR